MSEPTPYDKLGVDDDASFEQVRDARDRLLREYEGDESQQEAIEVAYDAILMDRLRARKEGKITVPDRIRYPERLTNTLPAAAQTKTQRRARQNGEVAGEGNEWCLIRSDKQRRMRDRFRCASAD